MQQDFFPPGATQLRTIILAATLASLLTVGPASAATIGFNNLVASGPVSSYSEAGFVVAATSGSWEASTSYGKPAPFIQFLRVAPEPTTTASIEVTSGGVPFRFSAVDLYSSLTPIPYVFVGLRDSLPIFTLSGTVPNTFGAFATVTSSQAQAIDTLRITLSNPATCCGGNPVGLDNIVVTAVPEPALALLLGVGVAAGRGRYANRQARTRARL
jgi:hypothetical protein